MAATAALALWAVAPAHALYKVIGPDGRVTYTDRPPGASVGRAVPMGRTPQDANDVTMPLVLREAMTRFPVTLFTTADCQPCEAGRNFLRQRGVPFAERAAGTTSADQDAWLRQTGSLDTPALAIGTQVLRGFSADTWNSWLDTAGYPRASALPTNYVPPAPQPLVARPSAAETPRAPSPAAAPRPPEEPTAPPAPGSIRF